MMFLYKRYKKKNNTCQIETTADSNPSHDMQLTVPDVSDSYACQQEIEISKELTSPCSEVQSTPDFTPHGTPGNGSKCTSTIYQCKPQSSLCIPKPDRVDLLRSTIQRVGPLINPYLAFVRNPSNVEVI
ncbi:Glutamate receptor 2.7 [Hordeum vulgare]|nr:Glutamate receptor 2.7 [Hordeum vulgare]